MRKQNAHVLGDTILVPRAYDPSGLRQESRALGATISCMRHRWRLSWTGWEEFSYRSYVHLSLLVYIGPEKPRWGVANYVYIYIYISVVISKWLLPELSIPAAGQKDHRLWGREWGDTKYW